VEQIKLKVETYFPLYAFLLLQMNLQENQTKSSVYQPTKCDMKYKEISQEDIPVCYYRMLKLTD
jgi:hypothetical protein